jgi:hexulose-6-phosphate isomerase
MSDSPDLYTAVKWSMVKLPEEANTVEDLFRTALETGFDGITLMAPGTYDLDEVLRAQDKTGIPIHNINIAEHWNVRLTDPDPSVREAALRNTLAAIEFAHAVGASSVLQVIGKVTDAEHENLEQVSQRSYEQLMKALPTASRLGVQIACENVANGHGTSRAEWIEYIDRFRSPWVGAFFDIGNHDRFDGGAAAWIRALGSRIVKIDVKDHDHTTEKNCSLFEGNVDWPDVRRALDEIGYTGWATAEVRGGDADALKVVASDMKKALGIS